MTELVHGNRFQGMDAFAHTGAGFADSAATHKSAAVRLICCMG